MIGRLETTGPAGRLGLAGPIAPGTRGVLVRPADGGVHRHPPPHQPRGVGEGHQPRPDQRPYPSGLPAPKQPEDRLPMPVPLGHIPPRRPDPHPPPHPIHQPPARPLARSSQPLGPGKQRLQHPPLPVGQILTRSNRYPGHRGLRADGLLGRRSIYRRPHSSPDTTYRPGTGLPKQSLSESACGLRLDGAQAAPYSARRWLLTCCLLSPMRERWQ